MSATSLPENERITDLLVDRAIGGLSESEQRELTRLLGRGEDARALSESFELAAAAVSLEELEVEGIPSDVAGRLSRTADAFLAGQRADEDDAPVLKLTGEFEDATRSISVESRVPGWAWMGWAASAALLGLAFVLGAPDRDPTVQELQAELRTVADFVSWAWDDPADGLPAETDGLGGEVEWSDSEDRGFMRFAGLDVNDPSETQYQLWIFDEQRPSGDLPEFGDSFLSQRPVDGGVFDLADAEVLPSGEVIVPIDAKLPVGKALAFAVTVEQPGGVVVSDRSLVVALAVRPSLE
ncbi:MAG: anti-sigma factor [Planctomycetota bacterium]